MSLKINIKQAEDSRISSFDPNQIVFGRVFTDHMFACDFTNNQWQNPRIEPFGKIPVSPTLSALHYGQSIFEGMKAFKNQQGEITLFRPLENWKRLNKSANRMCMPEIPEEIFMEGLKQLVSLDKDWIPTIEGSSLYLRPFMFATDDFLGVKPSENYCFMIYACPVNAYYSHALKVRIEENYTRASKGGVGAAKCAGNYAASMYPTRLAQKDGFDQVLWTDGENHEFLEETGTSNVFVVTDDSIYTPELNDSLLAGITRDSIITMLKSMEKNVVEAKISVKDLIQFHEQGKLKEMFVTGTAATITNIELFNFNGKNYKVPVEADSLSAELKNKLNKIRALVLPDNFNWMVNINHSEILSNN